MDYPYVKIEWEDACSYEELHDLDYNFCCSSVISVGRLFSKTDKQLVLMRDDYTEDDASHKISGVLCIPNGWVKSIVYLTPLEKGE